MNPFDYLNSVNFTKKNIMIDEETEKGYNSYIVNRSLSYFSDTIFYANEMNRFSSLDNKLKYNFFINTLRKRKRFSKFMKPEASSDIDVIKEYYNYSNTKAQQVVSLLSRDQIDKLKDRMFKGGTTRSR